MMMGARTGAWAKSGAPIPYDAEVEYLASNGNQWIDTLINPSYDWTFTFEFAYDRRWSVSDDLWVSSIRTPTRHYTPLQGNSRVETLVLGYAESYKSSTKGILNASEFHRVKTYIGAEYQYSEVNDVRVVEMNVHSMFSPEVTLPLFARRHTVNGIIPSGCNTYIKSFSALKGDECAADFVPVRFTNENIETEGAFYDKVSGQLFGNAGKGAFIIGPDKTT